MTEHEEKAKNLLETYRKQMLAPYGYPNNGLNSIDEIQAKECALIAIEFALKPIETKEGNNFVTTHPSRAMEKELNGIREEINKL